MTKNEVILESCSILMQGFEATPYDEDKAEEIEIELDSLLELFANAGAIRDFEIDAGSDVNTELLVGNGKIAAKITLIDVVTGGEHTERVTIGGWATNPRSGSQG